METNDCEWWNREFEHNWCVGTDGRQQTYYFAELILDNLPAEVKEYLRTPGIKILDWGCALGQAVNLFQTTYPKAKVTGLDFAETAISMARELFPKLNFRTKSLYGNGRYDVIFTSNVLEHFSNPLDYMRLHMKHTGKYYITLVPYNQGRCEGPIKDACHFYSFMVDSFPFQMEGFRIYSIKIIPPVRKDMWCEEQILVVYERVTVIAGNQMQR